MFIFVEHDLYVRSWLEHFVCTTAPVQRLVSSYMCLSYIIFSYRALLIRLCGNPRKHSNIHTASHSHPCPMGLGEKWKANKLFLRCHKDNDNLVRKARAMCTNQEKGKFHSLLPIRRADVRKAGPPYVQQLLGVTNTVTRTIPLFLLKNNSTTPLGNLFQSYLNFKAKKYFPHLDGIFCSFLSVSISSSSGTRYHCKESCPIFFTLALMRVECGDKIPSESSHLIKAASLSHCS